MCGTSLNFFRKTSMIIPCTHRKVNFHLDVLVNMFLSGSPTINKGDIQEMYHIKNQHISMQRSSGNSFTKKPKFPAIASLSHPERPCPGGP